MPLVATSRITHIQSSTYFLHPFDINADRLYDIKRYIIAICPPEATVAARHHQSIERFAGRSLRLGYRYNCVVGGRKYAAISNHSSSKKSSISFSICVRVGLRIFATSNSYMELFRMIQDFDRNTGRHNWQLSTGTRSDARRMKH